MGMGLVEHDQDRLAIERARQRDALALAARQHQAAVADLGFVTLRQPQDQFMHPGLRGRARPPPRTRTPPRGAAPAPPKAGPGSVCPAPPGPPTPPALPADKAKLTSCS